MCADIIKDSFSEAQQHTDVIFQKGRFVIDFELNEPQIIQKVATQRSLWGLIHHAERLSGVDDYQVLAAEDGWLVVGTAADDQVSITGGTATKPKFLFLDGMPIPIFASTTLACPAAPGAGSREDIVYAEIYEQEITDPNLVMKLGETTKRHRLVVQLAVSIIGSIPANGDGMIWTGAHRYYEIARITRYAGQAAINPNDVVDSRRKAPGTLLAQLTKQSNHVTFGNYLVTNKIATPDGTYKAESATMTIHLDEAGTYTGVIDRSLVLQSGVLPYKRILKATETAVPNPDDAPSFVEAGQGAAFSGDSISNEPLRLTDKNYRGGQVAGAKRYVELSSSVGANGDQTTRLNDIPITAGFEQPLLRLLNSQEKIVLGDGMFTFGHFNGATALQDALDWLVAEGTFRTSWHIYLKAGIYTLASAVTVPVGVSLILEGPASPTGLTSAIVTCEDSITLSDGCGFTAVYVSFYNDPANSTHCVVGSSNNRVNLTGCKFDNAPVKLTIPSLFTAENCWLQGQGAGNPDYLVHFDLDPDGSDADVLEAYKFNNCFFYGTAVGVAAVGAVVPAGVGAGLTVTLKGIEFYGCTYIQAAASASALVGGNRAHYGFAHVSPGTSGCAVTIGKYKFVDCDVIVGAPGAGNGTALFFFRGLWSGPSTVSVGEMHIVRSKFVADYGAWPVSPVYLGNGTKATDDSLTGYVNELYISDSEFSYSYDTPAGAVVHSTGGAPETFYASPYGAEEWFSCVFCAENIHIRDTLFNNWLYRGGVGVVWVRSNGLYWSGSTVKMNRLSWRDSGTYDGPHNLVRVDAKSDTSGLTPERRRIVIGLSLVGYESFSHWVDNPAADADVACQIGTLGLVPGGDLVVENCSVSGFSEVGTYPCICNRVAKTPVSSTENNGLTVRGCRVKYGNDSSIGFSAGSAAATSSLSMNGLSVVNCEFSDMGIGISISSTLWTTMNDLVVTGNTTRSPTGIQISAANASVSKANISHNSVYADDNGMLLGLYSGDTVIITDNHVVCDGAYGIEFTSNTEPSGIFRGNTVTKSNGDIWKVHFNWLMPGSVFARLLRDTYAGVEAPGAGGSVEYIYTAGLFMVHNYAVISNLVA